VKGTEIIFKKRRVSVSVCVCEREGGDFHVYQVGATDMASSFGEKYFYIQSPLFMAEIELDLGGPENWVTFSDSQHLFVQRST
jgi:hypothetical protein